MRKKWENIVVSVQYSEDFVNTIESVTFRVTYNGGEGKANVTISNNHDLPWNEVISCKCNWVLMTGRPCIHASFCLRFPHLDNKLPRDKFFEDFGTVLQPKLSCWSYDPTIHCDVSFSGVWKSDSRAIIPLAVHASGRFAICLNFFENNIAMSNLENIYLCGN